MGQSIVDNHFGMSKIIICLGKSLEFLQSQIQLQYVALVLNQRFDLVQNESFVVLQHDSVVNPAGIDAVKFQCWTPVNGGFLQKYVEKRTVFCVQVSCDENAKTFGSQRDQK